jgi:hypothetical protein
MFQNTSSAMEQIMEAVEASGGLKRLKMSKDEFYYMEKMVRQCMDYLELYDDEDFNSQIVDDEEEGEDE